MSIVPSNLLYSAVYVQTKPDRLIIQIVHTCSPHFYSCQPPGHRMTRLPKESDGTVHLPYTATWDLTSARDEVYRIQVAWPMHWTERSGHSHVPIMLVFLKNRRHHKR